MQSEKVNRIRNFFILLGSTLSVMQGALVSPALPQITLHFSSIENIEFLTKLIIAIPPIFIAIFSPIAGFLLEKYGRKRVLIFSAILYAFAGSSAYFSDDIYAILVGRAFLGISIAALMTGFIVVAGDLFKGDKLNKFIGLQGAIMSFAGVLFLIIGGKLADIEWNLPFLGYMSSAIIAIALLLFLNETKINKENVDSIVKKSSWNKNILIANLTAFFVMLCYLMVPTQIPFLLKSFSEISNQAIGLYLSAWILFSSIASLAYSKYKRKFSFYQLNYFAFSLWAFAYFLFYYATNNEYLLTALIISGVANGIIVPNLKAYILSTTDSELRGKQSGFLSMSLYIGQFLSPILVEPIIRFSNLQMPFLIFAILLILAASFYYFLNKKENQH